MIRLLLLALIICAGLFVGPMLMDQKGYVLIALNDWTIETSVVVMVMVVLVFYALLQLSEWAIVNTLSLWGRTRHWFGWRKHQLAREKTLNSLLALASGRFAIAEKDSARYASFSDKPLLNYITAAKAAQLQGKKAQRDKYLDYASEINAEDSALIATRLEMLVEDSNAEQAASWLSQQPKSITEQPEVLLLALPIYQQTQQWQLALDTAAKTLSNKLIDANTFAEVELAAHLSLLTEVAEQGAENLHNYYKKLGRKLRNNIDIFTRYAKLAIKLDSFSSVDNMLFKLLKQKSNQKLLLLLPSVTETQQVFDKLNSLEPLYQDESIYHVTKAQLLSKLRQWELAKIAYQRAIELAPSANCYNQLALVQQELGETNGALDSFNKALAH